MSRSKKTIRLFVAAYPPANLVAAMHAELAQLDLPQHRLTPTQQVHLTLQFIGDTAVKDLDSAIESVQRSASGLSECSLAPTRLISLPKRKPARLVALQTDAPATILELHSRLITRFARSPRKDSAKSYLPHLTLCRFRQPTKTVKIEHPVEAPAFSIDRLVLVRSVLSPDGAQHTPVEVVFLEKV